MLQKRCSNVSSEIIAGSFLCLGPRGEVLNGGEGFGSSDAINA